MAQVREHTESTRSQYGLAETAAGLGWPRTLIEVIDTDLGISGKWGVARAGFTELVTRLCRGDVGAIFGIEITRLARPTAGGERRAPLPRGSVHAAAGEAGTDPDAEVQAALRDVFAAFAACGSAYGVVAAFAGRRFPLRAYGGAWAGQLRWGRLAHARVLGILKNPCYAGAYVHGRYSTRRSVEPD